jgi:hypothetical protein
MEGVTHALIPRTTIEDQLDGDGEDTSKHDDGKRHFGTRNPGGTTTNDGCPYTTRLFHQLHIRTFTIGLNAFI